MKTNTLILAGLFALMISACQQSDPIQAKKDDLRAKKEKVQSLQAEITSLEKELSALDPEFGKINRKATLVTVDPLQKKDFKHFVEVSGAVKSRKNVLISSENMGAVNAILVKEGNAVKKGELIIRLDTELYQSTLERLQTDYALAKTMFEKQSNLWKQNIGTEVQYLEAKNRMESLDDQIENIKTQISKSMVRAPFTGTVEEVFVREGEMAQMGSPLVRIVNHNDMYVKADLSESNIGKFRKGDKVTIYFPSFDKSIVSTISSVGQVIDEQNRTFSVEAMLPATEFTIKPNLLAVVKIKDFEDPDAVVIPTKLIQSDNKGDFVFIAEETPEEMIAKKVPVDRGITYQNNTMILSGLTGNEILIDEGFRDVADGGKVKIVENVL